MARGLNPGHEEEHVPDVTTPQGSQSHSVDHGHEARDVNWKQLKIWFIVLALLTGGAQVGVLIGIFLYQKLQPVPHERVLAETELVPPAPRLLPNFIDSGNLRKEEIVGPVEALEIERRRDSLALAGLGLYDREHHLAHVPEAASGLPYRSIIEALTSDAIAGSSRGSMLTTTSSNSLPGVNFSSFKLSRSTDICCVQSCLHRNWIITSMSGRLCQNWPNLTSRPDSSRSSTSAGTAAFIF